MMDTAKRIWSKLASERGQALTEYSLVLLLIAVACMAALLALGLFINDWYSDFAAYLASIT